MTNEFRILVNTGSLHTVPAGSIFLLNITNPMSKLTQCMALIYPLFYMTVHQ